MAKMTVTIEGYGELKVKIPKKLNKKTFSSAIAEAVVKTCRILEPVSLETKFHPVLGIGGYTNKDV